MTFFLALLGAIFGAVIGGAVGFFGIIFLGFLSGADNQQGALAMGAAVVGLPLGLLVGGVLGLLLVLRLRRPVTSDPGAAAPVPDPSKVSGTSEQASSTTRFAWQAWAAIAVVALGIAAAWAWWTDDGIPPNLRRPWTVLQVELRLPADDPGLAFLTSRNTDLRSGIVFQSAGVPTPVRQDDDRLVMGLTSPLTYRTDDRELEMRLEPSKVLGFDIDLPERPQPDDGYTAWRRVDRFSWYREGLLVPTHGPPPYFIRYRVLKGN